MGKLQQNKFLGCCELPEHLREEVLAWLPLEYLCKFRIVCKQWNCLISSTKFITNKWAEAPPNSVPWLVVQWKVFQETDSAPFSLAYCFFTKTWKKTSSISLSFLLQEEEMTNYVFNCYGSAAGLFLAGTADPNPFPLVVANPLTRTSLHLPPLSSIRRIFARGIVEGDGDSHSYKVIVVGKADPLNPHVVEIYDSNEKSWRIAGQLPEEVQAVGTGMGMTMGIGMVFSDGFFYLLTITNGLWGIMGFGIKEGISVYAPLPEMANEKYIFPYLLACGSRVLVTGGIVKDTEGVLQDVIIWEFEKVKGDYCYLSSSSGWKEIARMPPSLYEDVNRTLSDIDCPCCLGVGDCACPFVCCVGVEDRVCFVVNRGMQVIEVVVYSVSERTWNWLPSCHVDDEDIWAGFVMAYEPRPDMKVAGCGINGTHFASHSCTGT